MISDYVLWYVLTASGFGCKHGWLVLRVRGVRDNFETVFGAYIETTGMFRPGDILYDVWTADPAQHFIFFCYTLLLVLYSTPWLHLLPAYCHHERLFGNHPGSGHHTIGHLNKLACLLYSWSWAGPRWFKGGHSKCRTQKGTKYMYIIVVPKRWRTKEVKMGTTGLWAMIYILKKNTIRHRP